MQPAVQTEASHQALATIRQAILRRFRKDKSPKFALLEQAIADAEFYHRDQFRKSGEPCIIHPFRVALLVSEAGMDLEAVIIALLHDVIEDTDLTKAMVGEKYGDWLAAVVDGLTKSVPPKDARPNSPAAIETYKKLLSATVRDLRTLQVKIFDRLDNMRDLGFLDRPRQRRISMETLMVYVPMAQRLGMQAICAELGALGFRYLYPLRIAKVLAALKKKIGEERKKVKGIQKMLGAALTDKATDAIIDPKYHQVTDYIFDRAGVGRALVGFTVCVADAEHCYTALGALHRAHRVVPNSIRDYISNPKPNRHQGLESKIFLGSEPVTIEVFSREMEVVNRMGILADWRASRDELSRYYRTYLELLDQLSDNDDLRMEDVLRYGQMDSLQVFTPLGEVVTLPQKATVLDFAFAIHTDLGIHCDGAWQENRRRGRFDVLTDGAMVEVITSPATLPNASWLANVVTPRAKLGVRRFLRTQKLSRAEDVGRRLFQAQLKRLGSDPKALLENPEFTSALGDLKMGPNRFFQKVGTRQIDLRAFLTDHQLVSKEEVERLEHPGSTGFLRYLKPRPRSPDPDLKIPEIGDEFIHLAPCCSPLPGDEIAGVQQEQGILIHRGECSVLADSDPEARISVGWEEGTGKSPHRLNLRVQDNPGQIYRIGKVMRDLKVNIHDLSVERLQPAEQQANIRVLVEPITLQTFHKIVTRLRAFKDVLKIS